MTSVLRKEERRGEGRGREKVGWGEEWRGEGYIEKLIVKTEAEIGVTLSQTKEHQE